MKQRFKVFKFSGSTINYIESSLNEWLDRNPNIVIDKLDTTSENHYAHNSLIASDTDIIVIVLYHTEE